MAGPPWSPWQRGAGSDRILVPRYQDWGIVATAPVTAGEIVLRGSCGKGYWREGSTPGRRITGPFGVKRMPAARPSAVVTPIKPKHISFVVCSPTSTSFGGLLGLLGFLSLLS